MSIYRNVHKLAAELKNFRKTRKPVEQKLTREQTDQIEELGHS